MARKLTLEEEIKLGEIIQGYKRDKKYSEIEYYEAREKLFKHNVKFAYYTAHKFFQKTNVRSYEKEDALQDVLTVLYEETDRYEPEYKNRFVTIAGWKVQKILSEKSFKSSKIPLNISSGWKLVDIYKLLAEKEETNNLEDRLTYITDRLPIKEPEAMTLLGLIDGVSSLEYVVGDDDELGNLIEDSHDSITEYENRELLERLLENLSTTDREIICHKYSIGSYITKSELLEKLSISENYYRKRTKEVMMILKNIAKQKEFAY